MINRILFTQKLNELALKQARLVYQSGRLRQQVVKESLPLIKPLKFIDGISGATASVRRAIGRHPGLFLTGVGIVILLRPRRLRGVFRLGLWGWRHFYRFEPRISHLISQICRKPSQ